MSFYGKVLEKINVINCIKKERGAIFVLTALLLPIMFGCLGIAYDVGTLYMHKARLQNVADAAALAGGRAYLQSQTKVNGKDSVDGTMDYRSKDIANCTYKGGRSMTVKYEYGKKTTIDRGNTTQHPDADAAADTYIFNNIVNLGNTVYADKYSHFALNYGNATSKIFYRIGLYETVPLRFLPIITDKYSETVRAGAIAYVEPGQPGENPGGGGSSTTILHPSMFDNLFTYSEEFVTDTVIADHSQDDPNEPDGRRIDVEINASFEGNMLYTHFNGLEDGSAGNISYEVSGNGSDTSSYNHFFENKNNGQRINKDNPWNNETNPINDPTIDSFYNTKDYVNAFKSWLNGPHIEITDHNKQNLNASDINNLNSDLYLTPEGRIESNIIYYNYNGNLNVYINQPIAATTKYNIYTPVYVIIESTVTLSNINMSNNANGRPVVFVYLGDKELWFQNANDFSGVIYAPYASVNVNYGGTFLGNIIAKKIQINASNKGIWIQKNFLENYEYNTDGEITGTLYEDPNIKAVSNTVEQRIRDANAALTDEIKSIIASAFGVERYEDLGNMDSYQQKTYAEKQQFYRTWKALYEQYKNNEAIRNILWPWNEHVNIETSGGSTVATPDNLRLINFRTEYRENGDPNAVVDPFIYVTLGNPLAY